ncbi:DUF4114 domain-containing protein, partial [Propionivibrio sp.]|uniref:DUF4114 domain-containing protein n=1 Tax=Propionivibrio sp. TaxID=2212460 RepID=UPI003BF0BD6E
TVIVDDSNPDTPDTPDEPNQEVVLVSIAGPATVNEGSTTTNYTVSLTETPLTAVNVKLTYTGTATDGTDYTKEVEVTVPAGSKTATFDLDTIDDVYADNGETIIVKLGAITGGGFESIKADATKDSVTTVIVDDSNPDTPDTPDEPTQESVRVQVYAVVGTNADNTLQLADANSVPEGQKATYVAYLLDPDGKVITDATGNVNITFADGSAGATDYRSTTTNVPLGVTFPADALLDKTTPESGETFTVNASGYDNEKSYENVEYGAAVTTTITDVAPPNLTAWSDNNNNGTGIESGIDNQTVKFIVTNKTTTNTFSSENANWSTSPVLTENGTLSPSLVSANLPKVNSLDATADVTFTFLSEVASFQNVVGWYDLGNPAVGHVVWANASNGASTYTVKDVPAGTQLAFFMIANGNLQNPGLIHDGDTVYFDAARQAHANSASGTLLKSQFQNAVWFSDSVDSGGSNHAIAGFADPSDPSLLTVAMEDYKSPSYQDFNDVKFTVHVGDAVESSATPVAFNLGVEIDQPAALVESARVAFTLGDGDVINIAEVMAVGQSLGLAVKETGLGTNVFDIAKDPLIAGDLVDAGKYDQLLDSFKIDVGYTKVSPPTAGSFDAVDTATNRQAEVTISIFGLADPLTETAHFFLNKEQHT